MNLTVCGSLHNYRNYVTLELLNDPHHKKDVTALPSLSKETVSRIFMTSNLVETPTSSLVGYLLCLFTFLFSLLSLLGTDPRGGWQNTFRELDSPYANVSLRQTESSHCRRKHNIPKPWGLFQGTLQFDRTPTAPAQMSKASGHQIYSRFSETRFFVNARVPKIE